MLTGGALLEARGVGVLRGARAVLEDVTFSIPAGAFLSIVGPNGAGKSTLLLACLGLLRSSGTLAVEGRLLRDYRARDLARRVAYVPQAEARSVPFRVEELVRLGRYPHSTRFSAPTAADRRAVQEALELTGTAAFAGRAVSSLSGGERQKVFLAAALAQETPLLLLDEPTAFLDPRHQAEIGALLKRLNRERGIGVVMVTHDVNLATACGDRVLALRDGRVAFFGPSSRFLDADLLESLYRVDFDLTQTAAGARRAFPRWAP